MARILAIGPHPDDLEIGMGGAIATLLAQGHAVTMCDLTNGEPFVCREELGLSSLDALL